VAGIGRVPSFEGNALRVSRRDQGKHAERTPEIFHNCAMLQKRVFPCDEQKPFGVESPSEVTQNK
jgi:hypothetical protein